MRTLVLRHTPLRHFTDEQRRILERLWNVNVIRGRDTRPVLGDTARGRAALPSHGSIAGGDAGIDCIRVQSSAVDPA